MGGSGKKGVHKIINLGFDIKLGLLILNKKFLKNRTSPQINFQVVLKYRWSVFESFDS